ncbi:MAG: Jag N-terminal domain-containing protein [Desulfovibrio sp.]|nr:Jag N-terminal domain-containing protein [Desulfovibrio sp.]
MSESKEFQGKNLDEAIEAACRHFDLKRDKLEIEIVSGGSSGIFGLVGVKKAVVRAKPRGSFKLVAEAPAEKPERAERPDKAERPERAPRREPAPREEAEPAEPRAEHRAEHRAEPRAEKPAESAPREAAATAEEAPADAAADSGEGREPRRSRRSRGRGRGGERSGERSGDRSGERSSERSGEREADSNRAPAPRRRERPRREADGNRNTAPRREANGNMAEDDENGAPQGIAHLDQAKLEEVAREVTGELLKPLVENAKVAVELLADRVCVRIEDPENSGLLIGREGQTLASIQYLVNRLVSKRMDASVRVQIDAGDYRENQDERLRQIARHLADKAMSTGRTQSTRPMSSYHRRVVHLTLQDDEHVFTRSKGEGSMKRVLIMTKRKGKNGEMLEEIPQDAARDFDDDARD